MSARCPLSTGFVSAGLLPTRRRAAAVLAVALAACSRSDGDNATTAFTPPPVATAAMEADAARETTSVGENDAASFDAARDDAALDAGPDARDD